MLSFIAIGFIAMVCYVADSEQFSLKGPTSFDSISGFEAYDGFLSDLTAGTYEFELQEHGSAFRFVEYEEGRQTDGIKFVLDLNDQAGCKLQYGNHYFLQIKKTNLKFFDVTTIDTTTKYSAPTPFRSPNSNRKISVILKGDLDCPATATFALIQAGVHGNPKVPYGVLTAWSSCQGGTEDYLEDDDATGFLVGRYEDCKVGKDVISGDKWPNEITDTEMQNRDTKDGFNVIVCLLHPNICVLYKRSEDYGSIFKLQHLDDGSSPHKRSTSRRGSSPARRSTSRRCSSPHRRSTSKRARRSTSRRCSKRARRSSSRRGSSPARRSSSSPDREPSDKHAANAIVGECVVCKNAQVKTAFVPCGHLYCKDCAETIMKDTNKCPCCFKRVDNSLDVFIP